MKTFNILALRIAHKLAKSHAESESNVVKTDGTEQLVQAVRRAAARMDKLGGKFEALAIFAHGIEHQVTCANMSRQAGGFGIELASGLFLAKLQQLAPLATQMNSMGLVRISACAAADHACPSSQKGQVVGNGRMLMSRIAKELDCRVIASDTTQKYLAQYRKELVQAADPIPNIAGVPTLETRVTKSADFGPWKGNVFQFLPDGTWKCIGQNPTRAHL